MVTTSNLKATTMQNGAVAFSGTLFPPSTDPFTKLVAAQENKVPFVLIESGGHYIFSRKRKALVSVKSIILDSLDQDVRCITFKKKYGFFGKTVPKHIRIHFESVQDVHELSEKDHIHFMKKIEIDTKKPWHKDQ